MGGLNVKNTMIERVLQIVAPHPCSGCGKVGVVLCDDCKYDISHEPFLGCFLCGRPQRYGICSEHDSYTTRAFIVSTRGGTLEALINALKFQRMKAAARPLARLIHHSLPTLPAGIICTYVPTVRSHIRQRGYDQTELLARHFAEMHKIEVATLLARVTNDTQHTVGKVQRAEQASRAFTLQGSRDLKGKTVLLIDDIVTTGSTLEAAAKVLSEAGATVWAAVLAYQPLD